MGNLARTNAEILTERVENAVTQFHKYSFGQHGSAFNDSNDTVSAPAGKVIVAIQFLGTMTLTRLIAENISGSESISSVTNGAGTNGEVIDATNKFPSGAMIYGRWTEVACTAQSAGGIICYFGY